jgi:tellurite resistance protein
MPQLSNEDRYFLVREFEQRAKWRARLEANAKAAAERQGVAKEVGVDDEQIADRIRSLGLDAETARVLHLMPLVEVAWADGKLSPRERRVILQLADAHGIQPSTPAAIMLASLLERRPSDTLLEQILEVLKDLLHAKDMHPHSVLEACLDVASASGGCFGFGNRVSNEERTLIEKIATTFGDAARAHVTEQLA